MSSISDLPTSSLQKTGIALEILFPLLSLITVSLRVYARLITRNFGWGEFILVSLPVTLRLGTAAHGFTTLD